MTIPSTNGPTMKSCLVERRERGRERERERERERVERVTEEYRIRILFCHVAGQHSSASRPDTNHKNPLTNLSQFLRLLAHQSTLHVGRNSTPQLPLFTVS